MCWKEVNLDELLDHQERIMPGTHLDVHNRYSTITPKSPPQYGRNLAPRQANQILPYLELSKGPNIFQPSPKCTSALRLFTRMC